LGAAQPLSLRVLAMIRQSHTNLVTGTFGHVVNGMGSLVLMLLAASSLPSWMSCGRAPRSRPIRLNVRSIHRQIGFWMLPFAILWGATGLILSVPALLGHGTVEWAYALHTGMGGGWIITGLWAASSLLTSILLLAGAVLLLSRAGAWWRKPGSL
jgi:uncharacterized iron-regulated membrane protein